MVHVLMDTILRTKTNITITKNERLLYFYVHCKYTDQNLVHMHSVLVFQAVLGYILTENAIIIIEPVHEISNNKVCATSKASDQPAYTRSLIRTYASRLSIL